jgi:hypothetical protein
MMFTTGQAGETPFDAAPYRYEIYVTEDADQEFTTLPGYLKRKGWSG